MATPGELVAVTAQVLGLNPINVAGQYRSLRQAGLVSKGGRGPSATISTPRDATMLLLAIIGDRSGRETPDAIASDLAAMRADLPFRWPRDSNDHSPPDTGEDELMGNCRWLFPGLDFAPLQSLEPGHSFGDCLERILAAASDGRIDHDHPMPGNEVLITVKYLGPVGSAGEVSVEIWKDGLRRFKEEILYSHWGADDARRDDFDMKVERSFGWKTISRLAEALRTGRKRRGQS